MADNRLTEATDIVARRLLAEEWDGAPDDAVIEDVCELVHDAWRETKWKQGVTSRLSESGEELMVDYADLTEAAKDLDRGSVRAVLVALHAHATGEA